MASEKEESDIDNSLSTWQKFKAGFSGGASAQMQTKRRMMQQNNEEAQLEAIKKRRALTQDPTQEP